MLFRSSSNLLGVTMFLSRRRRPEAATPQLLIGWTPPPSPLLPRPASAAGEPLDTAADGEKGRGGAEGDKAREGDKRGAEGEKESGLDRFACNIWCVGIGWREGRTADPSRSAVAAWRRLRTQSSRIAGTSSAGNTCTRCVQISSTASALLILFAVVHRPT